MRMSSYLILRSRTTIFSNWLKRLTRENLTVLDVGGRYQPYRPLLGNRAGRSVVIDWVQTSLVDVVADGEDVPFAPKVFDMVIATQVIEDFRAPPAAIKRIPSV